MAMPNHHFPQFQQQMSKPFGSFYNIVGQVSPAPVAYLVDQTHHPPYIPPFHVVGFAPVPASDASGAGDEFQQNFAFEPRQKRLKELDFLEHNYSQMSSNDILQGRSVSTGLGLSLDNGRLASSCDSPFLGLVGDEIDIELQRQDAELDRFLKVQADRLRQGVLEKLQSSQLQMLSYVEEKVLQKLREKEVELETINRKNIVLESRMEQLDLELSEWQQRAKQNEDLINTLKFNIQQLHAQNRDSNEGFGDSEVDDTASCCEGRGVDFHLLSKEISYVSNGAMTCKVCRLNRVCMLLLPCKHLCVCKECESKVSACPLCCASKSIGFEVYM